MSGFNVNYNAGGTVDEVNNIKKIEKIQGFASFTQPYNKMIKISIPGIIGMQEIEYQTPDFPVEMLAITVSATGYGEEDFYNMYVNEELWFDTWYLQEVKEGLFLGTSTYVKVLEPNTPIKIDFFNQSGTAKTLYIGFRTLREPENENDNN
ncbi:MAG: hypothetical protein B6I17_04115 [Tenericutes bacterium 4572_104]|nr:MAG: hypothetical protein B6I17_04115 [Tenericutes bacterium 4572_104]